MKNPNVITGTALLSILLLVSDLTAVAAQSAPTNSTAISPQALVQIEALREFKASLSPSQKKIQSRLLLAALREQGHSLLKKVPRLRTAATKDAQGLVDVQIDTAPTNGLALAVPQLGGKIAAMRTGKVRAKLPLGALEAIAKRSDVLRIKEPERARTWGLDVDKQGLAAHDIPALRTNYGLTGVGVKVGVISDSVDMLADEQAAGRLGPVTVLPGQAGTGAGEGTAMLEIIHAIAPDAQLYFATGEGGQDVFAGNIYALRDAGCKIIVDDLYYFSESVFQDGIIAEAVDNVTAYSDVLYVSAAGNAGNKALNTSSTWEGNFVDGGTPNPAGNIDTAYHLHKFPTGTTYTTLRSGSITGDTAYALLSWSDPNGASTNDYDLYVMDPFGQVEDASLNPQDGTEDPLESAAVVWSTDHLVIALYSGSPCYLHLAIEGAQLPTSLATSGAIRGHAGAVGAIAVAAVNGSRTNAAGTFSSTNVIESFSSDGPRRIFYDIVGNPFTNDFLATGGVVRQKPDLAAADGVTTGVPGFTNFFGTSCAAPQVAGIAALLRSANTNAPNSEIRRALQQGTLDIMRAGFDTNSGAGIVMADSAANQLIQPNLLVTGHTVQGGNGDGRIDYDECNTLMLTLTNQGYPVADSWLQVRTGTAETRVPDAGYPLGAVGVNETRMQPIRLSTGHNFRPGLPIHLDIISSTRGVMRTNGYDLQSGGTNIWKYGNSYLSYTFPPFSYRSSSFISISNMQGILTDISVRLDLVNPGGCPVYIALQGPYNIQQTLLANWSPVGHASGFVGTTTFKQSANISITNASYPITGSVRPYASFGPIFGKDATNANGGWYLQFWTSSNTVTLKSWGLSLATASAIDGGGQCDAATLAVDCSLSTNQVLVGDAALYNLVVTNIGPSTTSPTVFVFRQSPNLPSQRRWRPSISSRP